MTYGVTYEQWSNRSADSDTLRQGAPQCRSTSCTVRSLAATRRSPLR